MTPTIGGINLVTIYQKVGMFGVVRWGRNHGPNNCGFKLQLGRNCGNITLQ